MPDVQPLDLVCPDCQAAAGVDCHTSVAALDGTTHAARTETARLRSLPHGTCTACGGSLVLDTTHARHYLPDEAAACPPMPDPATQWTAYAEALNAGVQPGIVDPQLFAPDPVCPDCQTGKHAACTTQAWDHTTDGPSQCLCRDQEHQ